MSSPRSATAASRDVKPASISATVASMSCLGLMYSQRSGCHATRFRSASATPAGTRRAPLATAASTKRRHTGSMNCWPSSSYWYCLMVRLKVLKTAR